MGWAVNNGKYKTGQDREWPPTREEIGNIWSVRLQNEGERVGVPEWIRKRQLSPSALFLGLLIYLSRP